MNPKSAAEAYRTDAIGNAPPIKIIRHALRGHAMRFLDLAEREDPGRIRQSSFVEFVGTGPTDIVVELRSSLDRRREGAGAVTRELERLYLFVEEQISRPPSLQRSSRADSVRFDARSSSSLLEAWNQVELEVNRAA